MLDRIAATRVPVAFVILLRYRGGRLTFFGVTDRELMTRLVLIWLSPPLLVSVYRRASLLEQSFTPGWTAAIAIVLLASGWPVLFSPSAVAYAHELWWRFTSTATPPGSSRHHGSNGVRLDIRAREAAAFPAAPDRDALRMQTSSKQPPALRVRPDTSA